MHNDDKIPYIDESLAKQLEAIYKDASSQKHSKKEKPSHVENADEEERDRLIYKRHDWQQIEDRNYIYTNYIQVYTDNFARSSDQKHLFRNCLFGIIVFGLVFVFAIGGMAVYLTLRKPNIKMEDVVAVISAFGTCVTAAVILPKIIAENLFPVKEEDQSAKIFKEMLQSDIKLRKFHADKQLDSDVGNVEHEVEDDT